MSNAIGAFVGNISRDPEIKPSQGGDFAVFGLAVDVSFGKEGVEPLWVNCRAFGKQCDVVMKFAKKGSAVFVSGAINLNTYEPKDGGPPKTSLQLNIQSFQFVGQKRGGGGGYNRGGGGYGNNRGGYGGGQGGGSRWQGNRSQGGGGYQQRGGDTQYDRDAGRQADTYDHPASQSQDDVPY